MATVNGLWTDAKHGEEFNDGNERVVELGWKQFVGYDGGKWIRLIDGPTGYESFPLADIDKAIKGGGWAACFGTPGRYARLVIPAGEMARIASEAAQCCPYCGKTDASAQEVCLCEVGPEA